MNGCGLVDERLRPPTLRRRYLVAADRGDEVDAGASECELARRGPLLLANEACHAADHQEEQRRPRRR